MKLNVLRGCFDAYDRRNLQYDFAQDRTAMSPVLEMMKLMLAMSTSLLTHRHTSYVVLTTNMRYAHRGSELGGKLGSSTRQIFHLGAETLQSSW